MLYQKRRQALEDQIASLRAMLSLMQQELDMNQPLLAQGDVSRADILRMQRSVSDVTRQAVTPIQWQTIALQFPERRDPAFHLSLASAQVVDVAAGLGAVEVRRDGGDLRPAQVPGGSERAVAGQQEHAEAVVIPVGHDRIVLQSAKENEHAAGLRPGWLEVLVSRGQRRALECAVLVDMDFPIHEVRAAISRALNICLTALAAVFF